MPCAFKCGGGPQQPAEPRGHYFDHGPTPDDAPESIIVGDRLSVHIGVTHRFTKMHLRRGPSAQALVLAHRVIERQVAIQLVQASVPSA